MRGKGEGSIYQRQDGYWVGAAELPRGPDGKRRRRRVVRRYRVDVVDAMAKLLEEAKAGVVPDRKTTTGDYLRFWLDEVAHVRENTRKQYRSRIERVEPHIGDVRLYRLNAAHCQRLATELSRDFSVNTARATLGTIRQALEWGVGADLLARNPLAAVTLPRDTNDGSRVKVDDTLSSAESDAVLGAARGDEREVLFWLALRYGMRIGELLRLRWADVDLDGRRLHVRSSKTSSGVRELPLIDAAVGQLRRHLQKAADDSPDALLFPSSTGGALKPDRVRERWNELLTAAGIEHMCRSCGTTKECRPSVRRFHSSRHTAATYLLENDIPLEVVSAVLGHSSIKVTADIYAKVRADHIRKRLDELGDGFG